MNVNNFDRQCLGGNLELSHLETDLEFKLFNYKIVRMIHIAYFCIFTSAKLSIYQFE